MVRKVKRATKRPLRGDMLDEVLSRELERMISDGIEIAPISLAAVARRLGLGSRTTLYRPRRLNHIQTAAKRQRSAAAGDRQRAAARPGGPSEIDRLRKELNELRGYIAQIAINAHRLGLDPEALLRCAQQEVCSTPGAPDRVVLHYLSQLGLLDRLDANVRSLAR